MAQKSGFWNALLVNGEYDRKYNAEDYSDNLAVVISNGVLKSTADDLKVSASGLVISVAAGRGWINGKYYYNDSNYAFTAITAPTGGKRYDRVMLRYSKDLSSREISLVYVQGTVANDPVKPTPTRSGNIYELVLADIFVDTNATSVTITDQRANADLCGWVYSTAGDNSFFTSLDNSFNTWFEERKNTLASVTLFKRYNWRTVLTAETSTVTFAIPQYDADTCFLEVFVNGILDTATTDYTLSGSTLTFAGTLIAGTEVEVKVYKSIDGTGIQRVSDEITELQNTVATLDGVSKFTYVCTGANDNIALSEIAQAIYFGSYYAADLSPAAAAFLDAIGGNTFLAAMSAEAQITIDVVGRLGVITPFAGSGTSESRYRWFSLGVIATGEKRIAFDFAKCEKITIACAANTSNIIFYGTDLIIKNANVYAYSNGASCPIQMLAGSNNGGKIEAENCRFSISTSGLAVIAENGTFVNCWGKVVSSTSNAFCFAPKSVSLIRVIGGTFYAYIATSGMTPAIFYTYNTETNAVVLAHNINCPTVTLSGYSQQYLSVAGAGNTYIDGVVCTMNSSGTGNSINGQIWKSKTR